jgi:hypothetical protein
MRCMTALAIIEDFHVCKHRRLRLLVRVKVLHIDQFGLSSVAPCVRKSIATSPMGGIFLCQKDAGLCFSLPPNSDTIDRLPFAGGVRVNGRHRVPLMGRNPVGHRVVMEKGKEKGKIPEHDGEGGIRTPGTTRAQLISNQPPSTTRPPLRRNA